MPRLNLLLFGFLLLSSCSFLTDDAEHQGAYLHVTASTSITEGLNKSLNIQVHVSNVHAFEDVTLEHNTCPVTTNLTGVQDTSLTWYPAGACNDVLLRTKVKAGQTHLFTYDIPLRTILQDTPTGTYRVTVSTWFNHEGKMDFDAGTVLISEGGV